MMSVPNEATVILVVDDSPETLAMLNEALVSEGFSVLVALSGAQALSICNRIVPDLVLMDAVMSGMDGFESHRKLRENNRMAHVPVIFMTGLDSGEVATASLESGAVDYVQKPIRISELCARIRRHLLNAKQINESGNILDSRGLSTMVVDEACQGVMVHIRCCGAARYGRDRKNRNGHCTAVHAFQMDTACQTAGYLVGRQKHNGQIRGETGTFLHSQYHEKER